MARHRERVNPDNEEEEATRRLHTGTPNSSASRRPELTRDDTYYLSDGSCVLRVENTLFNVHRTFLSRDSSLFSDMFTLPQGPGNLEIDGYSDDNPIVLHGETVKEFRSFLWSIYALPHELMVVYTANADITDLINIARVAFKYLFRSVETWALDAINDHVNRKDSPLQSALKIEPPKISLHIISDQISHLMRLAQLCSHERLLSNMTSLLRKLMELSNSESIRYAHLAMSLADELDLRELRGIAYFKMIERATVVTSPDGYKVPMTGDGAEDEQLEKDEIFDSKGRLIISRQQHFRMLQGYHRLTCAWEKLRVEPVHFDHPAHSSTWHQRMCTYRWMDFWKEKARGEGVNQLGVGDLVGRLKAISKEFDRWEELSQMEYGCVESARKAISEKIKQVQTDLPDFFVEKSD